MIQVAKTEQFQDWFDGLKDLDGRARIQARMRRLTTGNAGDVQPVGEGMSELRIHCGPGYRVYFKRSHDTLIFFIGGTKATQMADIRTALWMARQLKD